MRFMNWLQYIDTSKFILFALILTRISGLVMTAPIFGTADVPAQVRAFLAFSLAILILPSQWTVAVANPDNLVNFLVIVACELLVGLSLGLGIVVLFTGLEVAGQIIGQVSGLAMAEIFDPAMDANVSVFSRMLSLVTLAVFVCIGGHRIVMAAMLDTFVAIPPGMAAMPDSLADCFATLVTQSFSLGIRASAPAVTALLLGNLILGLIGRTLPQLNILVIGFSINSLLLFGFLLLSVGAAVWIFQSQVEPAVTLLTESWRLPNHADWLH
jgi:flagellar biosynthetic protein FliR